MANKFSWQEWGALAGLIALIFGSGIAYQAFNSRVKSLENQIQAERVRIDGIVGGGRIIPSGVVLAFNSNECPRDAGWKAFAEGEGRFIIGAGRSSTGDGSIRFNQSEGRETITLTEGNLPSHGHGHTLSLKPFEDFFHTSADGAAEDTGRGGALFDGRYDNNYGSHEHEILGEIQPTGRNEPINIMPPYIALTFCEKT